MIVHKKKKESKALLKQCFIYPIVYLGVPGWHMVHTRLQTEVTRLKLIPKQQFAFQRAHSTVHQLGRVISDASDAMTYRHDSVIVIGQ